MTARQITKTKAAQGGSFERSGKSIALSGIVRSAVDIEDFCDAEDRIENHPLSRQECQAMRRDHADPDDEADAGAGYSDPRGNAPAGAVDQQAHQTGRPEYGHDQPQAEFAAEDDAEAGIGGLIEEVAGQQHDAAP